MVPTVALTLALRSVHVRDTSRVMNVPPDMILIATFVGYQRVIHTCRVSSRGLQNGVILIRSAAAVTNQILESWRLVALNLLLHWTEWGVRRPAYVRRDLLYLALV